MEYEFDVTTPRLHRRLLRHFTKTYKLPYTAVCCYAVVVMYKLPYTAVCCYAVVVMYKLPYTAVCCYAVVVMYKLPYMAVCCYAVVVMYKAICIEYYDCRRFCLNYPSNKMHFNLMYPSNRKQ